MPDIRRNNLVLRLHFFLFPNYILLLLLLSCVWLFETPRTVPCKAFLSFFISWSLLKLISIESVMPSNHLILCHPLLLLPSVFASIRVFSNELVLRIRWPKYWSFSISPSSEYSGLISSRIDRFDLLVVQGTLKSVLQHQNSKASVLWRSAFFMVQLSHSYKTTGKPQLWLDGPLSGNWLAIWIISKFFLISYGSVRVL